MSPRHRLEIKTYRIKIPFFCDNVFEYECCGQLDIVTEVKALDNSK